MENKTSSFAERLKTLMQIHKLSQSDMARRIGTTAPNVCRYLGGKYKAKQDVIYNIQQEFGVSAAWLIGYDVPMEKETQMINERLTTSELNLVEQYRELNGKEKEFVELIIKKIRQLN